ncbi:TetR/AcrR family transcriptional regulator C-terminal domain-containing protein [Streptomyces sp. B6B3]|uniref:TetR/AcrR family transcriptional regulator C-terminal domain-containing protein n=1 Tax=Streptomyces sp. B6B3 TaxID=3153570 RepID=UPI00325D9E2A
MPRPRSLSMDRLAAAALAVIDRDGLAGLSMRAVASELGMATMSLYRYVSDREQLEGLVVDRVLAGVDVDVVPSPGLPWRDQLAVLVERVRAAVARHPEVVPLTLTHRHTSAGVLRWAEAALVILTEAGFDGRRRVIALRSLLCYLIGAIQTEHLGPLAGSGTRTMAELPRDAFPLLAETAGDARRVGADEEFREGLDVLLRGLAP